MSIINRQTDGVNLTLRHSTYSCGDLDVHKDVLGDAATY